MTAIARVLLMQRRGRQERAEAWVVAERVGGRLLREMHHVRAALLARAAESRECLLALAERRVDGGAVEGGHVPIAREVLQRLQCAASLASATGGGLGPAERHRRRRLPRRQRLPALQRGDRLFVPALLAERATEVEVREHELRVERERRAGMLYGALVVALEVQDRGALDTQHVRQRVELERAIQLRHRLVHAAERRQQRRVPLTGAGVGRPQLESAREGLPCPSPVPVEPQPHEAERGVGLAERRVERQCPLGCGLRARHGLERPQPAELGVGQHRVAVGQPGVGRRIARRERDRALELGERPRHRLHAAPAPLLPAHQAGAVRLRIDRRHSTGGRQAHGGGDLAGDRTRQLILHREDLAQVPVVALRPHVRVVLGVGELQRQTHAVARAAHAAVEHVGRAELGGQGRLAPGERLSDRAASEHGQARGVDAAELRDQLLRQPLGEPVLGRVAAEIAQRQDRQPPAGGRGDLWLGSGARGVLAPPGVELVCIGPHGAERAMALAVHGELLAPLPALHRPHVTLEIGGDLLPGVEPRQHLALV